MEEGSEQGVGIFCNYDSFFAASLSRAVIQLPLYLSGNFELLATTKIFMGYPLLGLTVLTSWVLFRKINSKSK